MQKSQYWSPKTIKKYQFGKIKEILVHAYRNVPYYRKLFNDLRIEPVDIRTFDDFANLPILTKDIIKSNHQLLQAQNFSPDQFIANSTGGSTGEPLHFFQDRTYELWANAARYRGWYNIAECEVGDTCAVLWGAMHEVKEDFSQWERLRDYVLHGEVWLNAFNLSDERKEYFLKLCTLTKPKLLRGYVTAVDDFAHFLESTGKNIRGLQGVILCAETVDEHTQKYIEQVFGVPAFNTYGGRELSLIAMECSKHNGLHEISENNYVEFEDIDLTGYDNAGNLIITNLNNYAMPFIRYRIGDIGVKTSTTSCGCGRGLPLIKTIIGRSTEVLTFCGGVKIAGEMFIHLMKDFPFREYQFVQTSEESVTLRVHRNDSLDENLKEKLRLTYAKFLPDQVVLNIKQVDNFTKTPTGKFRFVLRK